MQLLGRYYSFVAGLTTAVDPPAYDYCGVYETITSGPFKVVTVQGNGES